MNRSIIEKLSTYSLISLFSIPVKNFISNFETIIEADIEDKIETQTEEKIPESVRTLETVPEIKKVPFVLKGILYDGRNSIAIIEQDFEKMLSIGESIDDRKILDIQPDFIVLDTGEKIYIEF